MKNAAKKQNKKNAEGVSSTAEHTPVEDDMIPVSEVAEGIESIAQAVNEPVNVEPEPIPEDLQELYDQVEADDTLPFELNADTVIAIPGRNGRVAERKMSDKDIKELSESIVENGQMQPGEVSLEADPQTGKWGLYLTFGFGRLAAIQLANKVRSVDEQIPFKAYVKINQDAVTGRVRNAVENLKRKELTVLDKVKLVEDLMAAPYNLSQADCARRLGVSRASITGFVKVSKFPVELKTMIKDGDISAKAALDLTFIEDPKELLAKAKSLAAQTGGAPVTAGTTKAVKKSSAKPASGGSDSRSITEVMKGLDFASDKKREKKLSPAVAEIIAIIADYAYGRIKSPENFYKKLVAYQ